MQTEFNQKTVTLATVALRGVVVFPGGTTAFEIGRKKSVNAVKRCLETGELILLVPQASIEAEDPADNDICEIGVIANILQCVKLSGGSYQVLAEGICRAKRLSSATRDEMLVSRACILDSPDENISDGGRKEAFERLAATFAQYLKRTGRQAKEMSENLERIEDLGNLTDFIASGFISDINDKIELLQETDSLSRALLAISLLEDELDIAELNDAISGKVRQNISKRQREAYLREQINVIRQELGDADEYAAEGDEYYEKIMARQLPDEVREKLLEENGKLSKMPFGTPEAVVIRNYIEICLELPWNKRSDDCTDIAAAEKILNADHDGLAKVKERILEFLAVKQLKPQLKGQIMLLVGPPGVGKTSVAKSIAKATNRSFARISLGGIRDEAEIRGHRRTYIGSMPGRIINALKLAGTSNSVILFDELDKLTSDSHGDPTSAMLEVLDPEQNNAFRDNFIEVPVDLSECLFIATANTLDTIPAPLLDRMEIIRMNSYSDIEKLSIAKNHLIPKQLLQHGLTKKQLRFTDDGITELIRGYTRENGVRSLEREISGICRKTAKKIVSGEVKSLTVNQKTVHKLLGADKFIPDAIYSEDEVGIVNGLAWTSVGGEMLRIEVLSMNGTGRLELTGSLGDVMKESAHAAVSYIRKHCGELGVASDFYKNTDLHIHVPEGAIPKDGPSAGITICTALVSELSGRSVKQTVAMTGEITLTGRVLPIGGLREKCMAAYRAGVKTVIIPFENMSDVEEFDREIKEVLTFVPVKHISQVLEIALNGSN